jgi:type III secretion protein HrpB1
MEMINVDESTQIAVEMKAAMAAGQFDLARSLWARLGEMVPALRDDPTLPVLAALGEGRANDALHLVNALPDDEWPQLRAMCMHACGDSQWERYAQAAEQSDDPFVRDAMKRLRAHSQESA